MMVSRSPGSGDVLVKDTDHLSHFSKDLLAGSLASQAFSDVVLRCAVGGNSPKGHAKGPYATIRVHRAVLAAMSDHMAQLLRPFPVEEDVHITLDETPYDVTRRIVEFAYAGEVKINKTLVTSVCDAAHRLKVKYLKDAFVKVTDKDYADMKAGKKTLETIQKEKGTGKAVVSSGTTLLAQPQKVEVVKKPIPVGRSGVKLDAMPQNVLKSSSTVTTAPTGSSAATTTVASKNKRGGGGGRGKKKAEKTVQEPKSNNPKTLLSKNMVPITTTGKPSGPIVVQPPMNSPPTLPTKPLPMPISQQPKVVIPSSVASITKPLPPSALPNVKKVMIPPMVRKPVVVSPPNMPIRMSPSGPGMNLGIRHPVPPQLLSLNAFQVETIRQPDGSHIQVLKQPVTSGGQIVKQIKPATSMALPVTMSTTVPKSMGGIVLPRGIIPAPATTGNIALVRTTASTKTVPSRMPPNTLAIAMEAITGANRGLVIPSTGTIRLPANPVPVSEIVGTLSPNRAGSMTTLVRKVVKKPTVVGMTSLLPHSPSFSPTGNRVIRVAAPTSAMKMPLSTSHSVSVPKPGIPATVPDDFLEDSGSESNKPNGSDNEASKSRAKGKARPRVNKKTKEQEEPQATPGATRSSARTTKPNKKASAAAAPKKKEDSKKTETTAKNSNSRKRKSPDGDDADEAPEPKKPNVTRPARSKRATTQTATAKSNNSANKKAVNQSTKQATNKASKPVPQQAKNAKRKPPVKKAELEQEEITGGKRVRRKRVIDDL